MQRPEQFDEDELAQLSASDTDSFKSSELRGLQRVTDGHLATPDDIDQSIMNEYLPKLSDVERGIAAGLYTLARIDGRGRAQQEARLGLENPPSKEQLAMDAEEAALQPVRQQVVAGKEIAHDDDLIQLYARLYVVIYEREIRRYQDLGLVLNEEESRIRKIARQDKQDHDAQGIHLDPELLRYFAVGRAMKALGLDVELSTSDLPRIGNYVKSYTSYYNQQSSNATQQNDTASQEVERPYGPGTFWSSQN